MDSFEELILIFSFRCRNH